VNLALGAVLLLAAVAGCAGGAEKRVIELAIRDGVLAREQRLIRVRQGDDVVLRWTTDRPISIHLHGYDIEKEVKPGPPTTMWFVARATGRFPITRHGPGEETTLAYLEVHPR
jgi:hypothetical protein